VSIFKWFDDVNTTTKQRHRVTFDDPETLVRKYKALPTACDTLVLGCHMPSAFSRICVHTWNYLMSYDVPKLLVERKMFSVYMWRIKALCLLIAGPVFSPAAAAPQHRGTMGVLLGLGSLLFAFSLPTPRDTKPTVAMRHRVTVWWKPSSESAVRSDVQGMKRELACTDTIIYCGYAALADGSFGVDPAPEGGWGNSSLCAQAVDSAAEAGLGVQIIVEGRVDGHVKAAMRVGGAAFGRQAAAVVRQRYPRVSGLNVDWEVGRNRTAAMPLPTQLEMDTFTAAFAHALSPFGLTLSVCASQWTSYVSSFSRILASNATIYDMGLYHGLSGAEWESKLRNASSNAGAGSLASGQLAVGLSLEPKFPWENSTSSLTERFDAIERSGATHLALFVWVGRERDTEFGLPPAVVKAWGKHLASFVNGTGAKPLPNTKKTRTQITPLPKIKTDDVVTGWHGPEVKVIAVGGRPMLSVDGAHEPPLWFVGHGDLTDATAKGQAEIDNFFTQINSSTRAGFTLVEILVDQWQRVNDTASGLSNKTMSSIDGILARNPSAMIILRPYILPAVEPSLLMCKENASATVLSGLTTPASAQWLYEAKAGLLPFLAAVDRAFPGHIAGVHLTGMSTGEWMWPGAGSTGDPVNTSATCDGEGAGKVISYSDYSESMRTAFCAASNLSKSCVLASPKERDTPRTGNSFVCGGSETAATASAIVRQNLLLAQVMADAIGRLAQAVKEASNNKALVLTFFGYVLHCTTDRHGSNSRNLVNSGHLAGSSLLSNPAVDGFVGTYSYSPNTRNIEMPLLPAGEFSSLWKHKKLWIIEDDTRTHLCSSDQVYGGFPLKWCHSLADTKSILRRNYLTASLLSHGSYLFDLQAQGWFGQARDPATADAIWQTVGDAVKAVSKVDVDSGPLPSAQIAVFFDELSAATQPLDSRLLDTRNASSRTISGDYTLHNSSLGLSGIGASFKHHYLTDLPTLDVSNVRFAVFLNAFAPSAAIRNSIAQKFARSNVSLLFLGPAGIVRLNDTSCTADGGRVGTFTGIDGLHALADAPQPAHTTIDPTAAASAQFPGLAALRGMRFGQQEPVAPRLSWKAPSTTSNHVQVLGRYTDTGKPSLLSVELPAGYRSIFSGASALPAALLRVLAQAAGVHSYADCTREHDCSVHASGNALLVHAGRRSATRTIYLPEPLLVEDEAGVTICGQPCVTFDIRLDRAESRLFFLRRAQDETEAPPDRHRHAATGATEKDYFAVWGASPASIQPSA
jgi:hypothetical protein